MPDLAPSAAEEMATKDEGVRLGQLLRQRRKEIGKTMKQVAQECDLTEGFISQVERGLSAPSLISLYKIANSLNAPVDAFLSEPPQHVASMVSRSETRAGYTVETKERVYEILERGFPGAKLNGCITRIPVGYASEMMTHEGEDFVYIIEGEILYEINGSQYYLKAGDTLHFPSSLPHRATNIGTIPARELWVGTTRIFNDAKNGAG